MKKIVGIAILLILISMQAYANIVTEYKLQRFYYDNGTEYDYDFDAGEYPWFDQNNSGWKLRNETSGPNNSTVSDSDVYTSGGYWNGYVKMTSEDAGLNDYGGDLVSAIRLWSRYTIPSDYLATTAVYYSNPSPTNVLSGNDFMQLSISNGGNDPDVEFRMGDEEEGENPNFLYVSFEGYSISLGSNEWPRDYILGLKLKIAQIVNNTATIYGYYYFGTTPPEPISTTGWTQIGNSIDFANWNQHEHEPFTTVEFNPEPSSILLMLIGAGFIARKKLFAIMK